MIDEEIDGLFGREEIFSELGSLTLTYSDLNSIVSVFIKENYSDYIS